MRSRNAAATFGSLLVALFLAAGFPIGSETSAPSNLYGSSTTQDNHGQQSPDVGDGGSVSTGPQEPDSLWLAVARRNHTATALSDGRVIMIGGDNQEGVVGEAEILDPSSNTLLVVARLLTPRTRHAATLLPDGRVLVTGGTNQTGALKSAEIFDPRTASFYEGPSLQKARAAHTATLLQDGRVLIVGGRRDRNAEIFDPITNRSVLLKGKMTTPREGHSAIRLGDGDVLLAGGEAGDGHNLESAELFNTATLDFSATTNPMLIPRARPALNLLHDGKVQVIGGDYDGTMEVFDPASRRFAAAAHLVPTADLLTTPELLSAQTRAGFIDAINYRDPNIKRQSSQRLADRVAALRHEFGRSQYAAAEMAGLDQVVVVGGVDDGSNIVASALIVKRARATISTNSVEQLPGDAPIITGSGWKPFEKVRIIRQEARLGHKRTTLHAVANKRGEFVSKDLTAGDYQVWVTYTLTARGESSGQVAQTAYFDAPPPGKEFETLPKMLKFDFPITNRDGSIETETILLKWRASLVPAKGADSNITTSAVTCSIPNGDQFNFNADFSDVLNQPCLGIPGNPCGRFGDVRLKEGCLAFSGSIRAAVCLDPTGLTCEPFFARFSVQEDFKASGLLAVDLTEDFNLPVANLPVPGLSTTITIPGLESVFSSTAGISVRAKIEATVTTPATLEPTFELSQGADVGFDTRNDPATFSEQTTTPGANGDVQVTKLGEASAKVKLGPQLGINVKTGGITIVDFNMGVFGFIEPAITGVKDTTTCKAGQLDLHAGIDGDLTAKALGILDETTGLNFLSQQISGFPKPFVLDDTQPPTFLGVQNFVVGTDPGTCGALVPYGNNITITDDCSGVDFGSITANPPPGTIFQKGTTTVNISARDNAGNLATTSLTVTVNDTEAPQFTSCPSNITQNTDPDLCTALVNFVANAADNCDGVVTPVCTPPSGSAFPKGTTTVDCTATDAAGNTSACSFNVMVRDAQKPTISNPDITKGTDPDQCSAVVSFTPTVSDNCPGLAAPVCSPPSGSTFPKGTTTVDCSVNDAAGNSESTSFTVTVNDTQAPTINCAAVASQSANTDADCSATVPDVRALVRAQSSDNCTASASLIVTQNPVQGSMVSGAGSYPILVTVVDEANNSAQCTVGFTVIDNVNPVARCKNATVFLDASGNGHISLADIENGSTDNCGIASYSLSKTSFDCSNLGLNIVRLTVTDTSGNTASCDATVTVIDNIAPQITSLTASPNSLWPPNHKMRDVRVDYTSSDNCAVASCSITSITSNEPDDGMGDGNTSQDWEIVDANHVRLRAERSGNGNGRIYTITVRCTDVAGNWTERSVNVVVAHNIKAPVSGAAFKINTPVKFTGNFWDMPGRTHTAQWDFDGLTTAGIVVEPSGLTPGKVTGTYTFSEPGVYRVRLNIIDDSGQTSYVSTAGDLEAFVVIYDPKAGYTIGGGWIPSPAGAFAADGSLTGKLGFGFTLEYNQNGTNPKGEAWVGFNLGDFEFNALNYDYLVISGARAQFRGFGKINGSAGYDFILTAIDGDLEGGGGVDKFRLKIWNKTTGAIIYDNQMGASDADDPITPVGSGSSIVIVK